MNSASLRVRNFVYELRFASCKKLRVMNSASLRVRNFVYELRFAPCNKLRVFNSASLRVTNFVYLTPLRSVYSLKEASRTAPQGLSYIYFFTARSASVHGVLYSLKEASLQPSGLSHTQFSYHSTYASFSRFTPPGVG